MTIGSDRLPHERQPGRRGRTASERESYLMIRRFDGESGGIGAVPEAWLTPMNTPPTLNKADREMIPVFAGME